MTVLSRAEFGKDFLLGVATSAYQIEGAVREDGRGPSIWDTFTHTPGKIKLSHNGDLACDHYHRLEQDLDLLAWLGVDAYRFSIAWPRVLPEGRGAVNEPGLDFYERLVDGLLERNIVPCATLYHWDLPQALTGGWLERATSHAFADYAALVGARLGDRVALWFTHNEPWCQAFLGYQIGIFAPGHHSRSEALRSAHELLVSHGLAVSALRSQVKTPIGIAPNMMPVHPATTSEADLLAAQRFDGYFNRWFLDPLAGKGYPADMIELYGADMKAISDEDMKTIALPIDVLGVNYYERAIVADDPKAPLGCRQLKGTEFWRTADREVYAPGLSDVVRRLHGEYGFQRLVITENGAAFADQVSADGAVHDPDRVAFFEQHLTQVIQLRKEGIPLEGYFAWSLMDNFEWAEGYTLRYGLVHVDFETQTRLPKDSAHFLRKLAQRKQETA